MTPSRRWLLAALVALLAVCAGCSAFDGSDPSPTVQPTPAPVPTDEPTPTTTDPADRTTLRIDNDWSGPADVTVYLLSESPSGLDVTYANGTTTRWGLSDEAALAFQLNDLSNAENVTDVRPAVSPDDRVVLVVEPGEASAELLGRDDARTALVVVRRVGDDESRFEAVTGVRCDPGQRLSLLDIETSQWGGARGAGGCEPAG